MAESTRNPPGAVAGGLRCLSSSDADSHQVARNRPPNQGLNLRVVPRSAPPRPRRCLTIRIVAFDHHYPLGRTRAILLRHDDDLDELIAVALRLEERA
jgi:hypothetical protein